MSANAFRHSSHRSRAIGILKVCQASLPVLHTPIVGVIINWTLEILQALEALEINSENARALSGLCQLLGDFTLRAGSSVYSKIIDDFAKDLEEISSYSQNILMRRNLFKKLFHLASDRRRLAHAKLRYDLAKGRFLIRVIDSIIGELLSMESRIDSLSDKVDSLSKRVDCRSEPAIHLENAIQALPVPGFKIIELFTIGIRHSYVE